MLDPTKIASIAATYSPQELFGALIWQRQFNEFDGQEIITDLAHHPDLWKSFLFTKPVYAPDKRGLSFCGLVDTLLAMANYRPLPETSMIHFISYPADTLYILAENQDVTVAQLMDFGKKWRADSVEVFDGTHVNEEWKFQDYLKVRLQQGLWGEKQEHDRDAVVLTYWWD